jgi:hypothetical protein
MNRSAFRYVCCWGGGGARSNYPTLRKNAKDGAPASWCGDRAQKRVASTANSPPASRLLFGRVDFDEAPDGRVPSARERFRQADEIEPEGRLGNTRECRSVRADPACGDPVH